MMSESSHSMTIEPKFVRAVKDKVDKFGGVDKIVILIRNNGKAQMFSFGTDQYSDINSLEIQDMDYERFDKEVALEMI